MGLKLGVGVGVTVDNRSVSGGGGEPAGPQTWDDATQTWTETTDTWETV